MHTFLPPRPESFPQYAAFVAANGYDGSTHRKPTRASEEGRKEIIAAVQRYKEAGVAGFIKAAAKELKISIGTVSRALKEE